MDPEGEETAAGALPGRGGTALRGRQGGGAGAGGDAHDLHTAKGLEWPVVVMTGMEHGLFPSARAEEQPAGVEEERRLCYVGLTRAKDKLYLTWARARRRGGELRPGIASRFLRAIPPGIIEERRTTSLWAPDWGRAAGQRGSGSGTVGARISEQRRGFRRSRVPRSAGPRRGERLTGHSPICKGRAGPPSPLRRRDHPGSGRHRSRSQGIGGLR